MRRASPGRSSAWLSLVLAIAVTGCAMRAGGGEGPGATGGGGGGRVALVAEGSAFATAADTARVARALERETGRRVVVVEGGVRAADTAADRLAARLAAAHPAVRGYGWREPDCAAATDVRTALAHDADAVYRVAVDHHEDLRPARPGDPRPSTFARVLGAVRLTHPGLVRDERLVGSVVLTTLTAAGRPTRAAVERRAVHAAPGPFPRRPEVVAAIEEVLRRLPPPAAPGWEPLARQLTSQGCPGLALLVYETRLATAREREAGRALALEAIDRRMQRRTSRRRSRHTEDRVERAIRAGELDTADGLLRRYKAEPRHDAAALARMSRALETARAEAESAARARDEKYSCKSLCSVHMVELCNNDRALWSTHRARYEDTPCGTRRPESFLQDCYRQQWLSGTYRDACVRPCEANDDGHQKLRGILQAAGCLRRPPS